LSDALIYGLALVVLVLVAFLVLARFFPQVTEAFVSRITSIDLGLKGLTIRRSPSSDERRAPAARSKTSFGELNDVLDYSEQLRSRRVRAIHDARDAHKGQAAELIVEAEFLVQAMRALDGGYRRIFGVLLGFNKRWNTEQRREAKIVLQEWLDQRIIIPNIRESRAALEHAPLQNTAVRRLVASADRYLAEAVAPLLERKERYEVQRRLLLALEQSGDYEFVTTWAKEILKSVDRGKPALAEADEALGMLKGSLPR
jgi:hypothetical protein